MIAGTEARDVVIVGGGHNGLTAAAYLAGAGLSVTVLERLDHVGGAAISEAVFPGVDARLSRYSYLVSLLPDRIRREKNGLVTTGPFSAVPKTGAKPIFDFPSGRPLGPDEWPEP